MENKIQKIELLKQRTKQFAVKIILFYKSLKKDEEIYIIGKQMIRSATSTAANYRAACRARSDAEFFSKISIVVEEADETLFWLELLQEINIMVPLELNKESLEIVKIMNTIRHNSKKKE
jgi:four helix bundle protein